VVSGRRRRGICGGQTGQVFPAGAGERREITVLFTDIRGFTTMSENLAPEALVSLLHDFLNPMSNIIINQGGTIDKYMGDAIMALFGAPLVQPDHPRLALNQHP
jgi:adenylate cyclase